MTPSQRIARLSKLFLISSSAKAYKVSCELGQTFDKWSLLTSNKAESSTTSTNPPSRLPLSAPTIVETPVFIRWSGTGSSPKNRSDGGHFAMSSGKNSSRALSSCVRIGLEPLRTMIILESGLIRFVLRPMAK